LIGVEENVFVKDIVTIMLYPRKIKAILVC